MTAQVLVGDGGTGTRPYYLFDFVAPPDRPVRLEAASDAYEASEAFLLPFLRVVIAYPPARDARARRAARDGRGTRARPGTAPEARPSAGCSPRPSPGRSPGPGPDACLALTEAGGEFLVAEVDWPEPLVRTHGAVRRTFTGPELDAFYAVLSQLRARL